MRSFYETAVIVFLRNGPHWNLKCQQVQIIHTDSVIRRAETSLSYAWDSHA
jgi:hypothetical protein